MRKKLRLFLLLQILTVGLLTLGGCSFSDLFHKCENFTLYVNEPTCRSGGYVCKICDECGAETPIDFTDALGHTTAVSKKGKEPSCTEEGLTDEVICTVCNYVIEKQQVIAPLGHNETLVSKGYEPTCNATGLKDLTVCSVCEETVSDGSVIPTLTHRDNDKNSYCDLCEVHYSEIATPISSVSDLKNIIMDMKGIYALASDISLADTEWISLGSEISPFRGYLFGNGHCISGLRISSTAIGGLFSHNSGVIENVKIKNLTISSNNINSTVGGLVCYNNGIVRNCSVIGENSLDYTAHLEKIVYEKDYNTITSYQTGVFGGLVGINEGSVIDCSCEGTFACIYYNTCRFSLSTTFSYLSGGDDLILNSTFYFGLIAGQNKNEIKDCTVATDTSHIINVNAEKVKTYGLAAINAYSYIGSITGLNTGNIIFCKATKANVVKNVQASNMIDGVFGYYGTNCYLSHNEDSVYKGIVGKNSGTMEGIVYYD